MIQTIKTFLYQTQQIRELEYLAKKRFGINSHLMMQRAGKAAFDFLQRRWPQAQKIAVFCGSGNNGGDGYVLANYAFERGLKVSIWQVGKLETMKDEAKNAYQACIHHSIDIYSFEETINLQHPDVIVDAICGIGIHQNLRDDIIPVIKKIQRAQVPILALDVPTGIDADTGQLLGMAVQATATMTFIGLKLGLLTGSGVAYTGELVSNDLQLPSDLFSQVTPIAEKIHLTSYNSYLKPRTRDWHKGLSGHVLVIGGDKGFSGAPRMAAQAALRVGAGLVTVATHDHHAQLINAAYPEIMSHGIQNASELSALITKANVIVIGPGLGQSPWAKELWDYASDQNLPLVIDADGLNLLSQTKKSNENWVLTPHPGEAARLINKSSEVIQADRLQAIKIINKHYGGVCVLKGAGSLVLSADSLPALSDKGNPGMATAGMGDILSGVIAGLIAQDIPLAQATKLGVVIHAMAGDLAAKEGERGMIATDLLPYLRRLSNYNEPSP